MVDEKEIVRRIRKWFEAQCEDIPSVIDDISIDKLSVVKKGDKAHSIYFLKWDADDEKVTVEEREIFRVKIPSKRFWKFTSEWIFSEHGDYYDKKTRVLFEVNGNEVSLELYKESKISK